MDTKTGFDLINAVCVTVGGALGVGGVYMKTKATELAKKKSAPVNEGNGDKYLTYKQAHEDFVPRSELEMFIAEMARDRVERKAAMLEDREERKITNERLYELANKVSELVGKME